MVMNKPGECRKCPTEMALCFGGAFIGPKPGYWRKSNLTYNFIKCVRPSACLYVHWLIIVYRGIVAPDYDPKGSCDDGHKGILCADCI